MLATRWPPRVASAGVRWNLRRERLVSRSGDSFAVAPDGVDDLVGGPGPLEGLGVGVPELDPLFQRAGQLVDGAEDTPLQATTLQFGEPSLYLVEPGRVGGGEVQREPGGLQQPRLPP